MKHSIMENRFQFIKYIVIPKSQFLCFALTSTLFNPFNVSKLWSVTVVLPNANSSKPTMKALSQCFNIF